MDQFFYEFLPLYFLTGIQFMRGAGTKMAFQDQVIGLFEYAYGRVHLLGDINAVFALINHFLDQVDLSLRLFQIELDFVYIRFYHDILLRNLW